MPKTPYKIFGTNIEIVYLYDNHIRTKITGFIDINGTDVVVIFSKVKNEHGWYWERIEHTGLWKVKDKVLGGTKVIRIDSDEYEKYKIDSEWISDLYENLWNKCLNLFSSKQ